jgi:hypothetical protein
MIRTQVFLRGDQSRNIKLKAKIENKPEAELTRELIDQGWAAKYGNEKQETAGNALLRLAKLGERLQLTGPTDLSSRIDDTLYGKNE